MRNFTLPNTFIIPIFASEKQPERMMKRKIIQVFVIFIATYGVLFAFGYGAKREFIKNDINRLFMEHSQHWHDSIAKVKKIPFISTRNFNSYEYFEARPCTIESETGICIIAAKYQISGDQYKHDVQMTQSMFIESVFLETGSQDIATMDSVWKSQLNAAGYDVDVALRMEVKSLFKMFPTPDTLVTDAETTLLSDRQLQGRNIFVTDTVGLGFCRQGQVVSEVYLPATTVIKNYKFFDWRFMIAATIALLFVTILYIKYIKENSTTIINVHETKIALGQIIYNCTARTLYNTANGKSVKLPSTQARLMELLAKAEGYTVAKSDICNEVWRLNEKDATSAYNSATWRLRENLQKTGGIRLVTIKDKALQLIVEKA
ncbi:MAG: helix-turn-helix domain-containing protein [Bacteroidaceae bacterium]|nr:helix-turn-helix domain-containing protein [Bacteroidaceae bacterium]